MRTGNAAESAAAVFVEASHEDDLMKAAGVSHAIGCESRAKYDSIGMGGYNVGIREVLVELDQSLGR